ncbi:GNAT family N-acetyltransferase [Cytobacillus sp. FJAT-54145]|uniref:GNAT family N-acetyltransferase n=1 Tax=Cytobacillus spartinae TaxID=3299023 RepID=A0ABW6K9F0_9BACI
MNNLKTIPVIETDHYSLRAMTKEDASAMFVFMGDNETMKFLTPHPVSNIDEMEKSIETSLDQFEVEKEIPWVIIDKKTEDVIGMFRLHKLHMWHQKAEMGVVLRKDYQNKGVMTEILSKVMEFSFLTLGLNRLVGDIFAKNNGSRKLLEKYGFHKDGVLRQTDFDGEEFHDTIVYSMLKEEYFKRNL